MRPFKECSETADFEDAWCGGEGDAGLDGIAIIVNGRYVSTPEDVDLLKDLNTYIEADFVFVQAKTSSHFDASEIGDFFYAVKDFFEPNPKLPRSEKVSEKSLVADHIFSLSAAMSRDLPRCTLYYVTTGKWTRDVNLLARIEAGIKDLSEKSIFSQITFEPWGADEIRKFYQATKRKLEISIEMPRKVLLPVISGVQEAYIGALPYAEFLKLITDETGKIRQTIFYDNLRAYQGENPVNESISQTLRKGWFEQFIALNNGITIVARSLTSFRETLTLRDFQIVNGCQTSHILYKHRGLSGIENLFIPVRIIICTNEDIVNSIIKATNNQTRVGPEELEALSEFQKKLEAFYQNYNGEVKLYYERRSRQYDNSDDVAKSRVVTIRNQIKSFAAMFLAEPHRVSRYYGTIVENIGGRVFSHDHEPIAYYTAALGQYRLENLFRSGNILSIYKKCRYHILMCLRLLLESSECPPLNSRAMTPYCEHLITMFNDPMLPIHVPIIIQAINKLGFDLADRDTFKTQSATDRLKEEFTAS